MNNLALAACRRRQSSRTHFVHQEDTIPLFENFCFALALFREHTKEAYLEGKQLLERLAAFQALDGNFPAYLHEYPHTSDRFLALKIAPALVHISRAFPALSLGPLERLLRYIASLDPLPPVWEMRRQALLGHAAPFTPSTSHDWFEWIVSRQLLETNLIIPLPYSSALQAFLGPHDIQEGSEPQPLPIEWLAATAPLSPRLQRDHFRQIHTALLFPAEVHEVPFARTQGFRLLWPGAALHSLVSPSGIPEGNRLLFHSQEVALYCDLSAETTLRINGQKGTVFYLGDLLTIDTPSTHIELQFHLLEGTGDFLGRILRANRPGQLHTHDAFDWKLSITPLRSFETFTLAAEIRPKSGRIP